jgi:phosphate transport system substrate-binding protein
MANRQSNKLTSSISVLAITISLVAAQSATQKSLAQFATSPAPTGVTSINGAGATSVNTLFVGTGTTGPLAPQGSWFNVFGVGNPSSLNNPAGIVNGPVAPTFTHRYASVGSGTGLRAFFTQTPPPVPAGTPALNNLTILPPVSFASSDDPVSATTFTTITGGPNNSGIATTSTAYVQVPVIGLGIALAFNRTGLNVPTTGLKLSRITYCSILNGTITNWNDPRIRTDNGGAIISPNLPIRVVRRSDSSGSTFLLTRHLSHVCKVIGTTGTPGAPGGPIPASDGTTGIPASHVWTLGFANTVAWPTSFLSASGGTGVANLIASTSGAIGYVDSATRLANNLPAAVLQNKAGIFTAISSTTIGHGLLGAANTDTIPQRRITILQSDPTNTTAYPIVGVNYALFYDKYANVTVANGIKAFINWALATPVPAGDASINPNTIAIARGYAPLPDAIKTQVRTLVNNCVDNVFDPLTCTP